jgi:cytochrome c oxidase subunit 2
VRFTHVLLAAGDPDNLNVLAPVAAPATSIRDLFYLVTAICAVIFLLVGGVLLYCIARFRHKPGDIHEPPQFYGSQPIEVAWTLAPLLTVFVLFLVIVRSVGETVQTDPPDGAMEITVRGHQWWWEYEYPQDGDFKVANELHVPVDRKVFLRLESADVVHSFWIPRLAGKTDVVPGKVNLMWFEAHEEGIFKGNCAEYCGNQHANMHLYAVVESESAFRQWIEEQKAGPRDDPEARRGREVFFAHNCIDCHTIHGTVAKGIFGPDLTHVGSRTTLAAGMVRLDDTKVDWMARWVDDPQKIKPGCLMPSLKLRKDEVEEVARYLRSLK